MFTHLALVACRALELVERAIEDEYKTRRLAALVLIVVLALVALNVTDPSPTDSESLLRKAGAWIAQTTTQALENR
ncbi:hypothetical protein [Nocardiopsis suaedae]|uniref:Uncharacterized protein n=1 Tax=Nocardiopsis suaedae TaxID=3018444 RepID=A0ABT4TTH8_9ACTN|nr:hypothetical protein [Nocardiopsis suaedae]MDA2808000.1 hypothetical protein [Nocardiopsis suaedae]